MERDKPGLMRRLQAKLIAWGPAPWLAVCMVSVSVLAGAAGLNAARDADPVTASYEEILDALSASGVDVIRDTDGDGLPDARENYIYGSDVDRWDTSGDGVPDGWLATWGYSPLRDHRNVPALPPAGVPPMYRPWPPDLSLSVVDVYRYGRPDDWNESRDGSFENGFDPRGADTNADGIPDLWLMAYGLDPRAELAADRLAGPLGLTVREAFENNTDPRTADSDGDGLLDRDEIRSTLEGHRFVPTDPRRWSTSGSGICDGYLIRAGLDATSPTVGEADPDRDGATTLDEYTWARSAAGDATCSAPAVPSPTIHSSGRSGLPDGWLMRFGLPLDAADVGRLVTETSGTTNLTVDDEYKYGRPADWPDQTIWWGGTDPRIGDTDSDGLTDLEEQLGWATALYPGVGQAAPIAGTARSDPTRSDADSDGLLDGAERDAGTHPGRRDSDFDGLPDGVEAAFGLDPTRADSVGDSLRDGRRMEILRARQDSILAGEPYGFPGAPGATRSHGDVAKAAGVTATSTEDLLAAYGPQGDLDGDGIVNVLDPDIDGDGLLNGWELRPTLYASTEYAATGLPGPRSTTDALHVDTDGDGLLDGWEVRFGVVNGDLRVMEPDPARYDTDGDGVPDAQEDPDGDSIIIYRFEGAGRQVRYYNHTNIAEQGAGTHPGKYSTDDDGLADGWKVYWGTLYAGPRALSGVVPTLGSVQDEAVITSIATVRFTTDPSHRLAHETPVSQPVRVQTATGETRFVARLEGTYAYTFLDAQAAGTNPFMLDTDHDGLPDAWEFYEGAVRIRAGCSPDPMSPVAADADRDADEDGLSHLQERSLRLDPLCSDTDLGGVEDGVERQFSGLDPLDAADDIGLLESGLDTDLDGISDYAEITGAVPTDPRLPDTDGDGLVDGADLGTVSAPFPADSPTAQAMLVHGIAFARLDDGLIFYGEQGLSHPGVADTAGDGVPDGWAAAHGRSPAQAVPVAWRTCYALGLPSWWSTAAHGVWWGGADPLTEDCEQAAEAFDRDGDGLGDANGEDVIPVANRANAFPLGVPADAADASDARRRAQAIVEPRQLRDYRVIAAPAPVEPPTVTQVHLRQLSIQDAVISRGGGTLVTGVVVDGSGDGVPGIVVVAELAGQTYGAAVTDGAGDFSMPVALVVDHEALVPADAVLLARQGPAVSWQVAADAPVGEQQLLVRSYARQAGGTIIGRDAQAMPVSIVADPSLSLEYPAAVRLGQGIPLVIVARDASQTPIAADIVIHWGPQTLSGLRTGADGRLAVTLPTAGQAAGLHPFQVDLLAPSPWIRSATQSGVTAVRDAGVLDARIKGTSDAGNTIVASGSARTSAGPIHGAPIEILLGTTLLATTVTSNGAWSASVALPPDLAPGPHMVHVRMLETSSVQATQRDLELLIRGASVIVETTDSTSAGATSMSVHLTDVNGAPLPGRTVHLSISGLETMNRTDASGRAVLTVPSGLGPGLHLQRLWFAGDGTYAGISAERVRFVREVPEIRLTPMRGAPGDMLTIRASVTSAAGGVLSGLRVGFLHNGEAIGAVITNATGVASLAWNIPADHAYGPAQITAFYASQPGSPYDDAQGSMVLYVSEATHLLMPRGPFLVGDASPTAQLVDGGGDPVRDQGLQIRSGEQVAQVVTDAQGRFSLTPGQPALLRAGDVSVGAVFAGTPALAPAENRTILVVRMPTAMILGPVAPIVKGAPYGLAVQITSPGGPVQDGRLLASIDGRTIGDAPVSNGRATLALRIPENLTAGPHALRVDYLGSSLFAAAHGDQTINVTRPVHLSMEAKPGRAGAVAIVTVRASTEAGPKAGASMLFMTHVGGIVATTDENGEAVITLATSDQATAITARFLGDAEAAPASHAAMLAPKEALVTHSSQATPWAWVLLPVLLAALAAVVLAIRWRQPMARAFKRLHRNVSARGPMEADVMMAYAIIEDELIANDVLGGPAESAGHLGSVMKRHLPRGAHGHVDALVRLFDQARYGMMRTTVDERDAARGALRAIRRHLMFSRVGWMEVHP